MFSFHCFIVDYLLIDSRWLYLLLHMDNFSSLHCFILTFLHFTPFWLLFFTLLHFNCSFFTLHHFDYSVLHITSFWPLFFILLHLDCSFLHITSFWPLNLYINYPFFILLHFQCSFLNITSFWLFFSSHHFRLRQQLFLWVLSTVDLSSWGKVVVVGRGQSGAKGECFIDVEGWTPLQYIHVVNNVQSILFPAYCG